MPTTVEPTVSVNNTVPESPVVSTQNVVESPTPTPIVENSTPEVVVAPEMPISGKEETPQVMASQPENPNTVVTTVAPQEEVNISEPVNSVPNVPIDNAQMVNNTNENSNTEVASAPTITIVDKEEEKAPKIEVPEPHEEPKTIYGGASPVIPKIEVPGEQHRPIYGGANPLENTGAIPTINKQTSINNAEPTPVVPTIPTVNEQPKVETVEPITVTTPQVETPTVETPKVEVPKQETVTPTVTETIPKVDTTPAAPKQEEEIESLF